MSKPKRKFRSTAQILKILIELKESGLSHREFALNRNIPLSTLASWQQRFRPVVGKAEKAAKAADIIPVGTICESPSLLEIEFSGGEVLRIGAGCRSEDLRLVLTELRRC